VLVASAAGFSVEVAKSAPIAIPDPTQAAILVTEKQEFPSCTAKTGAAALSGVSSGVVHGSPMITCIAVTTVGDVIVMQIVRVSASRLSLQFSFFDPKSRARRIPLKTPYSRMVRVVGMVDLHTLFRVGRLQTSICAGFSSDFCNHFRSRLVKASFDNRL
jgi:hypothetical protein